MRGDSEGNDKGWGWVGGVVYYSLVYHKKVAKPTEGTTFIIAVLH